MREYRWRLVAALADVDDHEALVHVDLGRGQADPGRRVHGLEHVVEQALELRGGDAFAFHRAGDVAQARVGKLEDREQGHGRRKMSGRAARAGSRNPPAGSGAGGGAANGGVGHNGGGEPAL